MAVHLNYIPHLSTQSPSSGQLQHFSPSVLSSAIAVAFVAYQIQKVRDKRRVFIDHSKYKHFTPARV